MEATDKKPRASSNVFALLFEVVVEARSLTTDEPVTSLKGSCWLRLVSGTELHGFWRHGKR
jgi:hypothetical protein